MRRARLFVVAFGLFASCSPPSRETTENTAVVVGSADTLRTLAALHVLPESMREHLEVSASGAHVGWSRPSPWRALASLDATLPLDGASPLHLAVANDPSVWVELVPEGLDPAKRAELHGSAVVMVGATTDTDVVHVAESGRVEELRLLRSPKASAKQRYRLKLGEGVSRARVTDGRVEIVDRDGRVRIASEPAWAVDAHGVKRDLSVRLESDALVVELATEGLAYPIAVDPAWTATAAMSTGRVGHGAARLPSGKVLVFGGCPSETPTTSTPILSTAEIYDPTANTWSAAAPMAAPRNRAGSVVLSDGKVLVAGGQTSFKTSTTLSTAELYDPATNTWSAAGAMAAPRVYHSIALLPGGKRAIVVGANPITAATEIYDETTNSWTATGALTDGRDFFGIATLADGRVLVVGGNGASSSLSTAEIYDAAKGTWTPTSEMNGQHSFVAAARLASGKVIAVGSNGSLDGAYFEIFDPATNVWTKGPFATFRSTVLVPLSTGKVLTVGGWGGGGSSTDFRQSWFFDPASSSLSKAGVMVDAFSQGGETVTLLPSDKVLVTGAADSSTAATEMFAFAANGAACSDGAECASGFCTDGVCCTTAACAGSCSACDVSGTGVCAAVTGAPHAGHSSCSPYAKCVAGACATSCTTDTDCDANSYCSMGACVAKKSNATKCGAADECSSGNCVDGVCCDGACDGQCAACDVAGSEGKCSQVLGAPHGTRTACAAGSTTQCSIQCLAGDMTKCGLPPVTTGCGVAGCTGGVQSLPGFCDGAGACKSDSRSCAPFVCGDMACKTSCTADTDCVKGSVCNAGVCVGVTGARCSDDGLSSIDKNGAPVSCEAYRCDTNGSCRSSCTSTDQCAPDYTCNGSTCVSNGGGDTGSSGGCSVSSAAHPRSQIGILLLCGLMLLRRRSALRR